MKDKLQAVHEARQALTDAQKARIDAYNAWLELEDTAALIEAEAKAKVAVSDAETAAKAEALALYSTGEYEKKGIPGVTIKEITGYQFDPAQALEWAKEHAPAAVTQALNTKAWNDICKSQAMRPEFVTVTTTNRADLDSDLSKALKEE